MCADPKIAIILLNYKNYNDTVQCLESLNRICYTNYEVIVVDNDSRNESVDILKKWECEQIHIIESGNNGGFAYGNNVGIRYALERNADYVLLLNNDTVVTPDFLNRMITSLGDGTNVGICTCRIMYNSEPDKVWYAGGRIDWSNQRAVHYDINQTTWKTALTNSVTFASGCCMLISKSCIKNAGLLPEEYFMYYEDLDYCAMAMEKGYALRYVPDAVIYHCVSSAGGGDNSPFVIEWKNRSRRRFFRKYRNKLSGLGWLFVWMKCEVKVIAKILLTDRTGRGIKAYIDSFNRKGN